MLCINVLLSFFLQLIKNSLQRSLVFCMNNLQPNIFGSSSLNWRHFTTALLHKNNSNDLLCVPFQHRLCLPFLNQNRGLKYKDVLTKRCDDCYFQKIEDRWYVFCKTHPRHKQAQKIDMQDKWIVTHITHGTKKY